MFPTRLATGLLSAALAFNAFAADYTFKFQSSDPSGVKNFEIQQQWADRVEEMTGGRVAIDLLPVGSVVSHTETLGAMNMGVLDGHVSVTGYFSGKDPAFGLIGNTVGAWSSPDQLIDYINYGGGYELMNELYAPYGVKFVGGGGKAKISTEEKLAILAKVRGVGMEIVQQESTEMLNRPKKQKAQDDN